MGGSFIHGCKGERKVNAKRGHGSKMGKKNHWCRESCSVGKMSQNGVKESIL